MTTTLVPRPRATLCFNISTDCAGPHNPFAARNIFIVNNKATDSVSPVGNKSTLCVYVWGAVTFVVTFGGFWLLDTSRISFTLAAILFPSTDPEVRYNYITAVLLSAPPLIIAAIAGRLHKSWSVSVGIVVVYALPVGAFFALVIPAWRW